MFAVRVHNSRRSAAAATVAAAAVLAGLAVGAPARTSVAQSRPRPNVLIIMTDDQRAGLFEGMPATRRWFRREGRRYPLAYATSPVCCPSRASVLSGQYSHNHEVLTNRDALALDQSTTLPGYLRQAGYLTALSGKYLNSWPIDQAPPHFDRFAMLAHPSSGGYINATFNVQGSVGPVDGYSTDLIRGFAVRYLRRFEREDARPWFLLVTPYAPHGPATPARRHRDVKVSAWDPSPAVEEEDRSDKPPYVQARSASRPDIFRRLQIRSLMAVDDLVERVMKELGALRENRRTLAFFLSDNGHLWGEHGVVDKRVPYPEAIRIPMMARWPGVIRSGSVDGRVALNIDIAPSVLDAAGIPSEHPMDGRSLLGPHQRNRVFTEFWSAEVPIPTWAALLTPTAQYVEYYDDSTGQVTFREYYDLATDPWYLENALYEQSSAEDPPPAVLQWFENQLEDDRDCVGVIGDDACP